MTKQEIMEAINKHPIFYLATLEGVKPHVRGMHMYKADENGIVFHTAKRKELYSELKANNVVELCFNADGTQIRISGKVEEVEDHALKDEIAADPTRGYLIPWLKTITKEVFYDQFVVFKLSEGKITLWTMERNLEPKIELEF